MKPRADIKARAKDALKERGSAVYYAGLIFVIFTILNTYVPSAIRLLNPGFYFVMRNGMFVVNPAIQTPFSLINLFVLLPLSVGYASFCIRAYRGEECSVAEMYNDGFGQYGRNLGGMLWRVLFTFLWTLLLVIPGIVKALAYSMTEYIMGEYKHIGGRRALQLSMLITDGRKMDIFIFGLSFIGWQILTGITMGFLGIYTVPYLRTSFAGLYLELKQEALVRGIVTEEDFM